MNKPDAPGLPLFGYAAVCAKEGELYVAALATDEDYKWNPRYFNTADLALRVQKMQAKYPHNRLLEQLGHCALTYGCFTAQSSLMAVGRAGFRYLLCAMPSVWAAYHCSPANAVPRRKAA